MKHHILSDLSFVAAPNCQSTEAASSIMADVTGPSTFSVPVSTNRSLTDLMFTSDLTDPALPNSSATLSLEETSATFFPGISSTVSKRARSPSPSPATPLSPVSRPFKLKFCFREKWSVSTASDDSDSAPTRQSSRLRKKRKQ